ncbi:MAG TPA: hypothetical protein VNW68_07580, partial [Candidatus Limnocylindria bacterium]|nr:hypothetical protein [Candidatus Limnocylindria bacterium]
MSRFAAGDAYPTELAEARMMVESCVACAELARDIRALMAAIVNLPAPARPRDFRLTAEQAQALAGGPVDRWLRRLAGARSFSYLRPAAAAVMSLGLAFAVIGSGVSLPQAATPAAAPADGRLYVATPEVAATPAPAEAPVPVDAPAPADEPDPGEAAPGAPPMMQPNGTSAAGRTGAEDTTARHEAMSDFDRAYELSLDELKAADLAAGPAADPARSALT